MKPIFFPLALLLPALLGALLLLRKPKTDRALRLCAGAAMLLSAALGWAALLCAQGGLTLLRLSGQLSLTLRFDGAGRFFAGLFSAAFPLTLLYADGYTADEQGRGTLFAGLLLAYAAALGCCMAGNLLTLLVFGELLSLCALPVLCYHKTPAAKRAARTLICFSLGGTVLSAAALAFLAANSAAAAFSAAVPALPEGPARAFYLLGFLGLGVKAAVLPLHLWLVRLHNMPTPSAAILEAVSVTNVGVLGLLRLTFHCFGTGVLAGSWVQTAVGVLSACSILCAAAMAVKQRPWKRKLAYSTIANLSYSLFALSLMTEAGFAGALLHAAFHTCGKLLAFFCAGGVLQQLERVGCARLAGVGRRMPRTLAAYTLASASLVGVPPLCGFVGKWYILTAATETRTPLGWLGAGVLLCAALLAAVYMFTNAVRAWFPPKDMDLSALDGVKEPPRWMLLCCWVLGLCLIVLGVCAGPLVRFAALAAGTGG